MNTCCLVWFKHSSAAVGRSSRRLHAALLAGLCWFATTQASAGELGPAGYLYLPEVDGNDIATIDTSTATIVHRTATGPLGVHPAVLAVTPDGNKIYSDNFGFFPATISILDRRTNALKTLPVGSTPLGAFTSRDGSEVYLPEVGFTVEVVSTRTDKVVRKLHFHEIPVASIEGPDGLLYVGFASGQLGAYDPQTGATVKRPIYSGGLFTFWYTFTRDGKKLYTDTVNQIGVIDVEKWKLTKTISTQASGKYHLSNPGAFTSTLSPDGRKLYVTVFGDTGVRVLDLATDTIEKIIPTKGSTTGVTFSADGSRGYISDMGATTSWLKTPLGELVLFGDMITFDLLTGPGQVVVFDPKTDEAVGDPIPTKPGPGISAWLPPLD